MGCIFMSLWEIKVECPHEILILMDTFLYIQAKISQFCQIGWECYACYSWLSDLRYVDIFAKSKASSVQPWLLQICLNGINFHTNCDFLNLYIYIY